MSVFRAIVFSAVVAGAIVGAVVTVAQQFGTVPLILKGEVYERAAGEAAAQPAQAAPAAHEHGDHQHDEAAWEPKEGFERNAYTAGANILTAIGFALLLGGIFALRARAVTWYEGLLWGLGGFITFTLAPGLGLPPELPGVPAAPLGERQLWWAATAAATAVGLGLLFLRRSPWAAVLGLCLIAFPHAIGAPHLEHVHTDVPEVLSRQFIAIVTLTSLLFWALLGSLTGILYRRFSAS
jgi:cobalt transporter subunit CbtA